MVLSPKAKLVTPPPHTHTIKFQGGELKHGATSPTSCSFFSTVQGFFWSPSCSLPSLCAKLLKTVPAFTTPAVTNLPPAAQSVIHVTPPGSPSDAALCVVQTVWLAVD
ncbi:hypothetical protein KIL84_009384 [Mauremys mutica]|uniref:Uncharacterized protein n=1 Tax=Mauremys mutica TaxID=74926 RepID=A0A9D3XJP0_9SAUR|nr:hypothetical protein KIL84_009384 [Mauremys mutica]